MLLRNSTLASENDFPFFYGDAIDLKFRGLQDLFSPPLSEKKRRDAQIWIRHITCMAVTALEPVYKARSFYLALGSDHFRLNKT